MKRLTALILCLCLLGACSLRETADTLFRAFSDTQAPAQEDSRAALLSLCQDCAGLWDDPAAYLEEMEARGWCAADKNHQLDMVHPEQLEAFLKGEAGAAQFLVMCGDGGFEAVTLTRERIDTVRVALVQGRAAVTWENSYELESLDYTEKGWLILTRIMPDNPQGGNHDGWQEPTLIYRVRPMDSALRTACRDYIEPIGYGTDGFFLTDWWPDDLSGLSFAGVFPAAYAIRYGRDLIYYESPYPVDETQTRARVPAEEYEQIMLPLLDLSAQQLRALAGYDGGCYPVYTVRTVNPRYGDVFPEVTALVENADGTLTLTVDGISPSLRTDRAFTHRVTLRPGDQGAVYLANQVEELN